MGIGHHDNLSGIGGVRKNLTVSAHGGVENHFTYVPQAPGERFRRLDQLVQDRRFRPERRSIVDFSV